MFPVTHAKTERQFGAAAVAVCISWFNLIWFLRRIPDIGTYILAIQKVLKTLFKVRMMHKFCGQLHVHNYKSRKDCP